MGYRVVQHVECGQSDIQSASKVEFNDMCCLISGVFTGFAKIIVSSESGFSLNWFITYSLYLLILYIKFIFSLYLLY